MKKSVSAAVAATSAAVPLSQAMVLTFDLADPTFSTTQSFYLDFDTGNFAINATVSGWDINFHNDYGNSEKPIIATTNNWLASTSRLTFGDDLAGPFNTSHGYFDQGYSMNALAWNGDTGGSIAYLSFGNASTGQEAWLEMDFNDAANTITLYSFAVGDVADNMTAGAVPEPAESALLMALAAGSLAAYRRRRNLAA